MNFRAVPVALLFLLVGCGKGPSGAYESTSGHVRVIEVVNGDTLRANWIDEGSSDLKTYRYTRDGSYLEIYDREVKVAIVLYNRRTDAFHIKPFVFSKKRLIQTRAERRQPNRPTRRYRQPRLRAADSGRVPIPIVRGEVSELHRYARHAMPVSIPATFDRSRSDLVPGPVEMLSFLVQSACAGISWWVPVLWGKGGSYRVSFSRGEGIDTFPFLFPGVRHAVSVTADFRLRDVPSSER